METCITLLPEVGWYQRHFHCTSAMIIDRRITRCNTPRTTIYIAVESPNWCDSSWTNCNGSEQASLGVSRHCALARGLHACTAPTGTVSTFAELLGGTCRTRNVRFLRRSSFPWRAEWRMLHCYEGRRSSLPLWHAQHLLSNACRVQAFPGHLLRPDEIEWSVKAKAYWCSVYLYIQE